MTTHDDVFFALERKVRAYVAKGSGLNPKLVIPGNSRGPKSADDDVASADTFATVLQMRYQDLGYPDRFEEQADNGAIVNHIRIQREVTYSVQWYRNLPCQSDTRFRLHRACT